MRRWLLACVGILLVADGYWASQNLVLKSADDGVYWFRFPPSGGQILIEAPAGEAQVDKNEQPRLDWSEGGWFSEGLPVSDIKNFIQYWKDSEANCFMGYHLDPNASIETAMATQDLSFASGAGDAAILSPVIDIVGKPDDRRTSLFFVTPKRNKNTCSFEEAWRKHWPKTEQAIGYPPELQSPDPPN